MIERFLNRKQAIPHTRYEAKKYTLETDPVLAHLLNSIPSMEQDGFGDVGRQHVRDYLADKWPGVDAEEVLNK